MTPNSSHAENAVEGKILNSRQKEAEAGATTFVSRERINPAFPRGGGGERPVHSRKSPPTHCIVESEDPKTLTHKFQ